MSLLLHLYRGFGWLARPGFGLYLRRRAARGKEDISRLQERYGQAGLPRPVGDVVWIHAASIGEMNVALPLIDRIVAAGSQVVLTTGTTTSAKLAESRLPAGAFHQFVPLDVGPWMRRFLHHWKPAVAILVESEIWPVMIDEAAGRNLPVVIVNGRMSEKSHRNWRRGGASAHRLFSNVDLCLARSSPDAERFLALGCPKVEAVGNLKLDGPSPAIDDAQLTALQKATEGRPVFLAASTHDGEERIIADVHRGLAPIIPSLLTIIAPRHPERGEEIARQLGSEGHAICCRSQEDLPQQATDIYLADTIGEMGLFFRRADVTFIGKSLAGGGGQNPVEAAGLDCPILHGPMVENFAEIFAGLDDADGAIRVADGSDLAVRVKHLLENPQAAEAMAQRASAFVDSASGVLDRVWQHIVLLLPNGSAGKNNAEHEVER